MVNQMNEFWNMLNNNYTRIVSMPGLSNTKGLAGSLEEVLELCNTMYNAHVLYSPQCIVLHYIVRSVCINITHFYVIK